MQGDQKKGREDAGAISLVPPFFICVFGVTSRSFTENYIRSWKQSANSAAYAMHDIPSRGLLKTKLTTNSAFDRWTMCSWRESRKNVCMRCFGWQHLVSGCTGGTSMTSNRESQKFCAQPLSWNNASPESSSQAARRERSKRPISKFLGSWLRNK